MLLLLLLLLLASGRLATREESDDEAHVVQFGPAPLYRRMGLPSHILVGRQGDRYYLSRSAGNEAIDAVLWFRREALQWHNLPGTTILPYHVHGEAWKRFKAWFEKSKLAAHAVQSSKKFIKVQGNTYGSQTQSGETPSRSALQGSVVTADPSPKLSPG